MLTLDTIVSGAGLTFFGDHADPQRFYYLPQVPRLSTRLEGDVSIPTIDLVSFRGTPVNGGVLSCDVDLAVPDDKLAAAADELKTLLQLPKPPSLVQMPVIAGSVRIELLGSVSTPANAPRPPAGTPTPLFAVSLIGSGTPSLYGDEAVSFSAQLDQAATEAVAAVLKGQAVILPIGVTYSLDYLALRPAYSVVASIDWHRVQTELDTHFTVDAMFTTTDVDTEIQKLVESQAIKLQATDFVEDSDENKPLTAQFDLALAEARELVKTTFFQPSAPPLKPEERDGWDKAAEFATKMSKIASTGGLAAFGGLTYKRVDFTRIDQKSLNVNFGERTAVRKTICPQGHLDGLFDRVKGGVSIDRFIQYVTLGDAFFTRRKVAVSKLRNFEAEGLDSVEATLRYGGTPQTVVLTDAQPSAEVSWPSELLNGAMVLPVDYSYVVRFKDANASQRPAMLATTDLPGSFQVDTDILRIDPQLVDGSHVLYSLVEVPIVTLEKFPWDRYPDVDVECRLVDAVQGQTQDQLFRLNKNASIGSYRIYSRGAAQQRFESRLVYHGDDSQAGGAPDVTLDWALSDPRQVFVADPFPAKLSLRISADAMNWSAVKSVYVDLSYRNGPDPADEEDASLVFSATTESTQTFTVHPKDPTYRLVGYELTFVNTDGTSRKVPLSTTEGRGTLLLRSDLRGHRTLYLRLPPVDFNAANIKSVAVDVRYLDTPNGLVDAPSTSTFDKPGTVATFEFDFVDAAVKPEYRMTTTYRNGLVRSVDWTAFDGDTLTLPVA